MISEVLTRFTKIRLAEPNFSNVDSALRAAEDQHVTQKKAELSYMTKKCSFSSIFHIKDFLDTV